MDVKDVKIRKIYTNVEEINSDGGKEIEGDKQNKRV